MVSPAMTLANRSLLDEASSPNKVTGAGIESPEFNLASQIAEIQAAIAQIPVGSVVTLDCSEALAAQVYAAAKHKGLKFKHVDASGSIISLAENETSEIITLANTISEQYSNLFEVESLEEAVAKKNPVFGFISRVALSNPLINQFSHLLSANKKAQELFALQENGGSRAVLSKKGNDFVLSFKNDQKTKDEFFRGEANLSQTVYNGVRGGLQSASLIAGSVFLTAALIPGAPVLSPMVLGWAAAMSTGYMYDWAVSTAGLAGSGIKNLFTRTLKENWESVKTITKHALPMAVASSVLSFAIGKGASQAVIAQMQSSEKTVSASLAQSARFASTMSSRIFFAGWYSKRLLKMAGQAGIQEGRNEYIMKSMRQYSLFTSATAFPTRMAVEEVASNQLPKFSNFFTGANVTHAVSTVTKPMVNDAIQSYSEIKEMAGNEIGHIINEGKTSVENAYNNLNDEKLWTLIDNQQEQPSEVFEGNALSNYTDHVLYAYLDEGYQPIGIEEIGSYPNENLVFIDLNEKIGDPSYNSPADFYEHLAVRQNYSDDLPNGITHTESGGIQQTIKVDNRISQWPLQVDITINEDDTFYTIMNKLKTENEYIGDTTMDNVTELIKTHPELFTFGPDVIILATDTSSPVKLDPVEITFNAINDPTRRSSVASKLFIGNDNPQENLSRDEIVGTVSWVGSYNERRQIVEYILQINEEHPQLTNELVNLGYSDDHIKNIYLNLAMEWYQSNQDPNISTFSKEDFDRYENKSPYGGMKNEMEIKKDIVTGSDITKFYNGENVDNTHDPLTESAVLAYRGDSADTATVNPQVSDDGSSSDTYAEDNNSTVPSVNSYRKDSDEAVNQANSAPVAQTQTDSSDTPQTQSTTSTSNNTQVAPDSVGVIQLSTNNSTVTNTRTITVNLNDNWAQFGERKEILQNAEKIVHQNPSLVDELQSQGYSDEEIQSILLNCGLEKYKDGDQFNISNYSPEQIQDFAENNPYPGAIENNLLQIVSSASSDFTNDTSDNTVSIDPSTHDGIVDIQKIIEEVQQDGIEPVYEPSEPAWMPARPTDPDATIHEPTANTTMDDKVKNIENVTFEDTTSTTPPIPHSLGDHFVQVDYSVLGSVLVNQSRFGTVIMVPVDNTNNDNNPFLRFDSDGKYVGRSNGMLGPNDDTSVFTYNNIELTPRVSTITEIMPDVTNSSNSSNDDKSQDTSVVEADTNPAEIQPKVDEPIEPPLDGSSNVDRLSEQAQRNEFYKTISSRPVVQDWVNGSFERANIVTITERIYDFNLNGDRSPEENIILAEQLYLHDLRDGNGFIDWQTVSPEEMEEKITEIEGNLPDRTNYSGLAPAIENAYKTGYTHPYEALFDEPIATFSVQGDTAESWGWSFFHGGNLLTLNDIEAVTGSLSSPNGTIVANYDSVFTRSSLYSQPWFNHTDVGSDIITGTHAHAMFPGLVVGVGHGLKGPDGLGEHAILIRSNNSIGTDENGEPLYVYASYGHVEENDIQVGGFVATGDMLAPIGDEGNTNGKHLDLTIFIAPESSVRTNEQGRFGFKPFEQEDETLSKVLVLNTDQIITAINPRHY